MEISEGGKNLSNFVPPVWKLHNPYCHIRHGSYMFDTMRIQTSKIQRVSFFFLKRQELTETFVFSIKDIDKGITLICKYSFTVNKFGIILAAQIWEISVSFSASRGRVNFIFFCLKRLFVFCFERNLIKFLEFFFSVWVSKIMDKNVHCVT